MQIYYYTAGVRSSSLNRDDDILKFEKKIHL